MQLLGPSTFGMLAIDVELRKSAGGLEMGEVRGSERPQAVAASIPIGPRQRRRQCTDQQLYPPEIVHC
jgi:hypothetical protein